MPTLAELQTSYAQLEGQGLGGVIGPATDAGNITPSDTLLSRVTRAIRCGGAGDLVVKMLSGNVVTFTVADGEVVDVAAVAVMAASTATNIVAYY